jgi:hypothetical protein
MKVYLILFFLSYCIIGFSQEGIDPTNLPKTSFVPLVQVNSKTQKVTIRKDDIIESGLVLLLEDKTFKVIQFDVVFDCPSKSILDFSVKRYLGDKIPANDTYFKRRGRIGDGITISNIVIEKDNYKLVMRELYFVLAN